MFLPYCETPRFTAIQKTGKIIVLYNKIFVFWGAANMKIKYCAPNDKVDK
jgi:hypothetical protein